MDKTLYVVGYAHLDTQWRWDYVTTIDEFLKNTMQENFDRFEQFPQYLFNFTGSARYRMMKEYYPEDFLKLKEYVQAGRWIISGSSVDEGDVNVPSSESIIRHVLYGNHYFRKEFGHASDDYMLPDCFGFPASLPTIWVHCGLKGFSTQKLTWGSAVGIPFNVGVWEGPDGNSVISALNPGAYDGHVEHRLDTSPQWIERIEENGKHGVYADYHYYGVGDRGGAAQYDDVKMVVNSLNNPDSQIDILISSSDQMFHDITPQQKSGLPVYKGDMLLTEHSAGTLTSQAYMKRWNRKNELLADAAERAAVTAYWTGGADYPTDKLTQAWERVLQSQMHDTLPGTCLPKAYEYAWNDEVLAMNQFAAVLKDSVGAVTRSLDTQTQGQGQALAVYNPLSQPREDLVEATVVWPNTAPAAVRVFDPENKEIPSQILKRDQNKIQILFPARVEAVSFSVYDIRPAQTPYPDDSNLSVSGQSLENERYRIRLDENGDIASIIDKQNDDREMLSGPARLEFQHENPRQFPAWNMYWEDRKNPPFDYVKGPAQIRIVEKGPVRVSLEVTRSARDSIFTQRISLAAGDAGNRAEVDMHIDWQSRGCSLKQAFPLTVGNPLATYNWGCGTIERDNNNPKKFEVPSHEWFDLTDSDGKYGVSVLEDCKFGSDKPADNILRLTLLYTPNTRGSYDDQSTQDWGRHDMRYALYGHAGDWRQAQSEWQGRRLNIPLRAFQAPSHPGSLGRCFSLFTVSTPQVDVRAVKRTENDDVLIVRFQELWGRPTGAFDLSLPAEIQTAYEVDGQERRIGEADYSGKTLKLAMTPYSLRSFALKLKKPERPHVPPKCHPVALDYDTDLVSLGANRADGSWTNGMTIPGEQLPGEITTEGIRFHLGNSSEQQMNALTCRGQKIVLPEGNFNRLYFLAAADEDTVGDFQVNQQVVSVPVQKWTGFIGQYDNRIWDRAFEKIDYTCKGYVVGLANGYIKRDDVAWFCSHRHTPEKNDTYQFSYLFKYGLDLPRNAGEITLPNNPKIRVFAMTLADNSNDAVRPAQPLYDDFSDRPAPTLRVFTAPAYLHQAKPTGTVKRDRQDTYEKLSVGMPSATDYADVNSGNNVTVHYLEGPQLAQPHPGSGAQGTALPRLIDGDYARNQDDTGRCVWYDQREGRFVMDLQRDISIKEIRTFSRHVTNRAPQIYTLWGAAGPDMPEATFENELPSGWSLLGNVNTADLGEGGIHGVSITSNGKNSLGTYRYLLWIIEGRGQNVFLTEIDVFTAE